MIHHPVFLIGYMGSGKTTFGSILAYHLQCPFFDLDTMVEAHTGQEISEIFKTQGEPAFRQMETEVLQRVPLDPPFVMATGGGAPCHGNNMAWMLTHGRVIYLRTSITTIIERLWKAKAGRPLVEPFTSRRSLQSYISEHLKEREKWYLQAHHVIDPEAVNPSILASQLMQ